MTTLNVRLDEGVKQAASKVFAELGLDLSTGVKLFLHQVVNENGLPFTPTRNPVMLRAKWDASVADALKSGRVYKTAQEALEDL